MVCCTVASLLVDFCESLGLRELELVVHDIVGLRWCTPLHLLATIAA